MTRALRGTVSVAALAVLAALAGCSGPSAGDPYGYDSALGDTAQVCGHNLGGSWVRAEDSACDASAPGYASYLYPLHSGTMAVPNYGQPMILGPHAFVPVPTGRGGLSGYRVYRPVPYAQRGAGNGANLSGTAGPSTIRRGGLGVPAAVATTSSTSPTPSRSSGT